MKMNHLICLPSAFRVGGAALLVLAAGCTSLSGEKLGPVSNNPNESVSPKGIPYTLMRPEFTLTATAAADGKSEPTYSLNVEYVPDLNQTYSLRIDPGLFTDPTFSMKLTKGTLESTNASATDRIVPTLVSLGQFTAALIGAKAASVLDVGNVRSVVAAQFEENTASDCNKISDIRPIRLKQDSSKTREAIAGRIRAYKDDTTFFARFHYVTEQEKSCMKEVAKSQESTEERKSILEGWNATKKKFPSMNIISADFIKQLDRAISQGDTRALEDMQSKITQPKPPSAQLNPVDDAQAKLLSLAISKAKSINADTAKKTLEAILNLSPADWRGRNVLYLEETMDALTLKALTITDRNAVVRKEILSEIARVKQEVADTIGAEALYARKLNLDSFIARLSERDVQGGKAPAAQEYSIARAELDEIEKRISDLRARAVSNSKPPAKDARKPTREGKTVVTLAPPGFRPDKDVNETSADYVLVLKEAK